MNFKSATFAIIIIGMLITSVGLILAEWNYAYNSGVSSDLEGLSKLSEASSEAGTQQGKINPQSGEASTDFETGTYKGVYGIVTGMYASLRMVYGDDGMIDSVMERFGIPSFIWQGITAMIVVAITMTLVSIVFRKAQETV